MQVSEESEEMSREEMLNSLFEEEGALEPSKDIPSHMTAPRDDDGDLQLVRYTYVDEDTCIGCTYCADIARSTFFMEQDIKGAARVYHQGGDSEDTIEEAIDACPVNCISHVSYEDLVTLETERIQREGMLDFNNYASFKKGWIGQSAAIPETKAEFYGSAKAGLQCDNCPSRGCKKCPMFGVGQNPVYLKRLEARKKKKIESGQQAREDFDSAVQDQIDKIYDPVSAEEYRPPPERFAVGARVEVNWDGEWWPAVITQVSSDDYEVEWVDDPDVLNTVDAKVRTRMNNIE
jgi:ferredoxin